MLNNTGLGTGPVLRGADPAEGTTRWEPPVCVYSFINTSVYLLSPSVSLVIVELLRLCAGAFPSLCCSCPYPFNERPCRGRY